MAKKLYEEDNIRAIAAAIRSKNGTATAYKCSEMAPAIEALELGGVLDGVYLTDTMKIKALYCVKKAFEERGDDCITFMAASDAGLNDNNASQVADSCAAMKISLDIMPDTDFCCFLGDHCADDADIDTKRRNMQRTAALLGAAFEQKPQLRIPGERDGLGGESLYPYIGKYNSGAEFGSQIGGYCLRDFEDKRLRVICLNTSENGAAADEMTSAQLLWFAKALRSVGEKAGWGIIILSHHPLDSGTGVSEAAGIIKSYLDGGDAVIAGTMVSFSGCNKAKIYAAMHGHTCDFEMSKLKYSGVELPLLSVSVPDMCNSSTDGKGRDLKWTATLNVIDPAAGKFYSYVTASGYDRFTDIL